MNISQLTKLDIRNIGKEVDIKNLKEKVYRPSLLINIALVVVTLIITNNIFSGKKAAAGNLRKQVVAAEKKLTAAQEILQNQKQLNEYIDKAPQGISAEKIIDILTDLSLKHKVQILSFSPAKKESKTLYDQTSVRINVSAETYQDLWLFVRDIESSESALKIKSWMGRLDEPAIRTPQITVPNLQENRTAVYAQMEIDSIQLRK